MIPPKTLATYLNLFVLFFLVAGRIEIESLGLKIGGKIENLFPLLALAWFLDRDSRSIPLGRILFPHLAGIFLILTALAAGCIRNFSSDSMEGLLRFSLQIGSGVLLGKWLSRNLYSEIRWTYVWICGLVILQIGTPWWGILTQPEMESSFGHRNLQSAFYLLSFPLMAFLVHAHSGTSRKERIVRWVCGLLLLSEAAFVFLSKSRSGLAGILAAILIWLSVKGRLRTPHLPRTWKGYALAGAVFVALLTVSPRLLSIGREISDPYYLSRSGVWSAAIEGFRTPSKWLMGAGMGEGYFWTIQESPIGNLNFKYRRGHHPHNLYLQWIYWGGITALIGWFFILAAIRSQSLKKTNRWEILLLGSCLLGYAFLEIFETALKNSRLNALFWLTLTLLSAMSNQLNPGKEGPTSVVAQTRVWGIRPLAFFLPVLWAPLFGIPELLSLGVILAAIALLQWPRFRELLESQAPITSGGNRWWTLMPILGTLFLLSLYVPFVETLNLPPTALLILLVLVYTAFHIEKLSQPAITPTAPLKSHSALPSEGSSKALICLTLMVPLIVGIFVTCSFGLSSYQIPEVFKPREGLLTSLVLAILWWITWRRMGGKFSVLPSSGGTFPLPLAIASLMLLSTILGIRILGTGLSYLSYSGKTATMNKWDHLLQRSQRLGLPPIEWEIRKSALARAGIDGESATWVHWAKDADRDPMEELKPPSPLTEFLARGGKVQPAMGNIPQATPAALMVDGSLKALWILYRQGQLVEISDQIRTHILNPEASYFTHVCQGHKGIPLILRADGELLQFDGTPGVLCAPTYQFGEVVFRRLCLDPNTKQIWSLDLFGNLYRFEEGSGWIQDQRFKEVSRLGNQTYDIARDFAITPDGQVALLDCFGQVWKSPIDSTTIQGPFRETHYWPGLPLGQSLQAVGNDLILGDRFGGVYLTPYPQDPAILSLRGSYLFPRSLSRSEQDVIDLEFLPERRWLYLLTQSGRILTNHRWGDVWAE